MSQGTLVPVTESKHASDAALAVVTKVGDYLPYIQLCGSSTTLAKEGKITMGHFALVKGKNVTNLTNEFHAVLCSWRPKAMDFNEMVSFFDSNDPQFKAIQAEVDENSNCGKGYGPEFLVWLPEYNQFAVFFFSSVTARNEAPNTYTFLHKACTFYSQLIKGKKHTWHGVVTKACALQEFAMPDPDTLASVTQKFNNPPDNATEQAETAGSSRD